MTDARPHRWYLTGAAVREYMAIVGLPPVDDGPPFQRAELEIGALCHDARLTRDEGHRKIYRVKTLIGGLVARLELYVATAQRSEGPLEQLVRVRDCGGSRTGKDR